jgi:hypothetical protein
MTETQPRTPIIPRDDDATPREVTSTMTFLARSPLFHTEKPFQTDFLVDGIPGAAMTNHVFDVRPVTFRDVRCQPPLDLDRNGVAFLKARASLTVGEATSERTPVMEKFVEEVISVLRGEFSHYTDIRFMDFSPRGARLRMGDVFPEEEEKGEFAGRTFDLIK